MSRHMIHMKEACSTKGMADAIREHLMIIERMDTQLLFAEDGSYIVQARETADWKKLVGMDKAITIKITELADSSVMLEIGQGKWSDKAVAGVVSWFMLWPLAFTTTIGAAQQASLPNRILMAAERYAVGS